MRESGGVAGDRDVRGRFLLDFMSCSIYDLLEMILAMYKANFVSYTPN